MGPAMSKLTSSARSRPKGRRALWPGLSRCLGLSTLVLLSACARVVPPKGAPVTLVEGGSVWVHNLFWGILEDDANVQCSHGGLASVETNVVVPVSVLTLGIWTPTRVAYECELPRRRLEEVENGQ